MKWNDEKGWGFLEATEPCTKDYWAEYRELDKTPLGRVLTMIRIAMVYAFADEAKDWPIVDVGIGDLWDHVASPVGASLLANPLVARHRKIREQVQSPKGTRSYERCANAVPRRSPSSDARIPRPAIRPRSSHGG